MSLEATSIQCTDEKVSAINDLHRRAESSVRDALSCAVQCGALLSKVKAAQSHGSWRSWVSEHCVFSLRTAQAYMRVAKHQAKLSDAQRVAPLPLRDALKTVSGSPKKRVPNDREPRNAILPQAHLIDDLLDAALDWARKEDLTRESDDFDVSKHADADEALEHLKDRAIELYCRGSKALPYRRVLGRKQAYFGVV